MKNFVLVSGTPRSGSTLLMNVAHQNPAFFVPPWSTSGLLDLVVNVAQAWRDNPWFTAAGRNRVRERVRESMAGQIAGFYPELKSGRVILDKHRSWTRHIGLLEQITGQKAQVIYPIRDIRAIVASMEKQYRKHRGMDGLDAPGSLEERVNDWIRTKPEMLPNGQALPPGLVGGPIKAMRDATETGQRDRIHFLRYGQFVSDPKAAMEGVHEFLGVGSFEYDFNNVEQHTQDDDTVFGMPDLHSIRGRIEPPKGCPWQDILPPQVCKHLAQIFSDVQFRANGDSAL